ncbi:MAG: VWA domain-containing protein [Chloroflexaceae bacterium]|jgi:Mg-chelatase subunit ChlD|nr:VWA domain-containing protein [Chloroflexaceae bacterium]
MSLTLQKLSQSRKAAKDSRESVFVPSFACFAPLREIKDACVGRPVQAVAVVLLLLALLAMPRPAAALELPPPDTANSDVVLVIDNSGSMRENDPNYLRLAAAKLFVDLADPGDKISIVVLSDSRYTRVLTEGMIPIGDGRNSNVVELKQAIDDLRKEPMGTETHMGSALNLAYDQLDRLPSPFQRHRLGLANQRQFVVMLSDGLPTGAGQRELVDQMAGRFEARSYWKVFSVALGAEADPDYLRQRVAEPTGGEVVVARDATELLTSYLEVYARAGDDRFISKVQVQPNTLAPLVLTKPDHQPTHITTVLIRNTPDAAINNLLAPDAADVVQPFYQNTVRRGAEPEYELYKVALDAQVSLVGPWQINVEQQSAEPVTVVVLSRSRLRMQMALPAALREGDDSSVRYHPVGRPLLLVAGAAVAIPRALYSKEFDYRWVTEMTPMAQKIGPTSGDAVPMVDDGRFFDRAANDGMYSALFPAFEAPGDYKLRLEMPRRTDQPINVYRDYTVRAMPLPTMQVTLPPAATTLPLNIQFTGLIDLPGSGDFQIGNVGFPIALVERPDGTLDPLEVTPQGDGRFSFNYTPAFEGRYQLRLAAAVQGNGNVGTIRYVDYTEASFAVPEAVPVVRLTAAFTQTLTYDGNVLQVPISIRSESPQEERLFVDIDGLPGSATIPGEVLAAPNAETQRTIAVHLPQDELPEAGELTLVVSSADQRVIVEGGEILVPFKAAPGAGLLVLLGLLIILGGGGYCGYRLFKQKRQVKFAPPPRSPGRWS